MGEGDNFEPYIAWDELTEEMRDDFVPKYREFRDVQTQLETNPSPENVGKLLRLQMEIGAMASAITSTLHRLPVMIHVAGKKITDEDGEPIQRCSRCGSVLQYWTESMMVPSSFGLVEVSEEDLMWWDEGDVIAKATDESHMTVYKIEDDHKLEKHERECVNLAGLADG